MDFKEKKLAEFDKVCKSIILLEGGEEWYNGSANDYTLYDSGIHTDTIKQFISDLIDEMVGKIPEKKELKTITNISTSNDEVLIKIEDYDKLADGVLEIVGKNEDWNSCRDEFIKNLNN